MNDLTNITPGGGGKPVRISTRQIAEICDKEHKTVLRDVRGMLSTLYAGPEGSFEALICRGTNLYHPGWEVVMDGARDRISEIIFDSEHAMTLVTGYDVHLRKRVVDKLSELEHRTRFMVPNFSDPATAARAWADQFEARQLAERTKAEIGSRREATAMNTASQAVKKADRLKQELDRAKQYATVKRMSMLHHGQDFPWRLLKQTCSEMGIPAIDVFDANYGTVKAYHADVWREAFALEIPSNEE